MIKSSREIAFSILYKVEFEQAYANISLSHELRDLNFADKGFVTELVYGVIERKITLDYFIGRFSTVPVRKLDKEVLIILRLACYQILYMDKVPAHSACDEAVKLSKFKAPKRSGFINAVLRSMSSEKMVIPKYSKKDYHSRLRFLSVNYSLPEWLIDRWIKAWGEDEATKLFDSFLKRPSFCIRYNRLKTNREDLMQRLSAKGFISEPSMLSEFGIIIQNPTGLFETEEFVTGLFYVQDEAAMLVSQALNPSEGQKILDCCSAPGGKTTHLGELMQDKGQIIACDIYPHKLGLIEQNASRLGISCIKAMLMDAAEYNEAFTEVFDKVLIDAPCSGSGLLRRKPEIKWARNEKDFENLSNLQMKILRNCSNYIKTSGELVYSTCSIDREENEIVVKDFLKNDSRFELMEIELPLKSNEKGMLSLYPHAQGCDGFFIAKMRKVN